MLISALITLGLMMWWIIEVFVMPVQHAKPDRSTRIKNNLHQTLRSKYPYMSDADIDKMVRKTLRIK